ncbi:MAG TPA: AbrB family transcriptional regulator [Crinalium sp.]
MQETIRVPVALDDPISNRLLIVIQIVLAVLIGLGFIAIGVGGGSWILGGIASGALVFYLYRAFYNNQAEPNRNFRKIGQMLVGLTVGFAIAHSNLTALSLQLPTFILLALFLLSSGGAIGYVYSQLERTDLLTGLLCTVPGNIGVMASIAADYGKKASLVSLVQLIRFTTVTLVIPLMAHVTTQHNVGDVVSALVHDVSIFNSTYLLLLALVLAIAALAVQLGSRIKLPVAAFFGSIIVGILFNLSLDSLHILPSASFNLPSFLNVIGQVLLGITIGEYWGMNPHLKRRSLAYTIVPVVLTCLAGFISAGLAMLLTDWDWLTCLLVTAPGGSPEMILIALTLNHDVEIVTAGHLIRLIAINLALPLVISLACKFERQAQSTI